MRIIMAFLVFILKILESLVRSAFSPAPPRPSPHLDPEQQVVQLELIRRRRGYKPGWLYYRCRELGLDGTLMELRASGGLPEHGQPAEKASVAPCAVPQRHGSQRLTTSIGPTVLRRSRALRARVPGIRSAVRLAVLPTIGVLAALAINPPSVASDASPTIRYPTAADFQVLGISLSIPLPPEYSLPAVRIYGDGRVWRHKPSYMKRAGDYEAWLAPEDLDRLLRFVSDQGLMAFDRETVKAKHREAELRRQAETGGVPGVADAPTTAIHIDLEAYAPPGVDEPAEGFAKTISWYALDSVVSWYPEIAELRKLQEVAEVLWELGDRAEAAVGRGETVISLPDFTESGL